MTIAKFRPLLSELDIDFLVAAIDNMPSSVQGAATRKKLHTFQRKIDAGLVTIAARVSSTNSGLGSKQSQLESIMSEEEMKQYLEDEMNKLLGAPKVEGSSEGVGNV